MVESSKKFLKRLRNFVPDWTHIAPEGDFCLSSVVPYDSTKTSKVS